jgi:hypothetical protein
MSGKPEYLWKIRVGEQMIRVRESLSLEEENSSG